MFININNSEIYRRNHKDINFNKSSRSGINDKSEMVNFHLRIKKELHTDIRDLAHLKGISINQLILNAVQHEIYDNDVHLSVYRQNQKLSSMQSMI